MTEPEVVEGATSRVGNEVSGQVAGSVVQAGWIGTVVLQAPVPAPAVVPRQLPPSPRGFVNRREELARLDGYLAEAGALDEPLTVVVSGLGGVGKSAISRHWAHGVCDRFEDGHLYVDLGVHRHGGGVEVSDVLSGFLRSLGAAEELIPSTLADRSALFRSMTFGRRLLVLVDDAQQAAEVTPLRPSSAHSAVVVTSQRHLSGLIVEGARSVAVSPLTVEQSVHLLSDVVGVTRVSSEPEAAEELARLCGGLPIALRVVAAKLLRRSNRPIGKLVGELADGRRRLDRFATEGSNSVHEVFESAYRELPPEAAHLYRLFGLLPLSTFSAEIAAVLAEGDAERPVESLLGMHLIEEPAPGGYRMHDLVKLHAARCAEQEVTSAGHEAALRAVTVWYRDALSAADRMIMGDRIRLAPRLDVPGDLPFAAPGQALDWLEAERGNVLALLRQAATAGWHDLVWQIAEALWALYDQRKHYADWLECSRLGADAAHSLGHRAAEARMRNQLARALIELGDFRTALDELGRAAHAADAADDPRVVAVVLESYGQAELAQNRGEAAAGWFGQALEIHRKLGRRRGVGLQTYHLGLAYARSGRYEAAVEAFERALSVMLELNEELLHGKIAVELGDVYRRLGRPDDAADSLRRGLAIAQRHRNTAKQLRALRLLADLAADAGDRRQERRFLNHALELCEASGNQVAAHDLRERIGPAER